MAFAGGPSSAFATTVNFLKCYSTRLANSRMCHHAIRVIRHPAAGQQPRNAFEMLKESPNMILFALVGGIGGSSLLYLLSQQNSTFDSITGSTPTLVTGGTGEHEKRKLTAREKRFIKFASVEHDGQIYMTPQDFLESVVESEPRTRFKRKRLTDEDVTNMMKRMPKLYRNNEQFFGGLGNRGLISFSEYLFLLTILIKPQSGFKIAFAMLDQDGNGGIDRDEFRLLETVFSSAAKDRKGESTAVAGTEGQELKSSTDVKKPGKLLFDDADFGLLRAHDVSVDTTLLVYFFGKRGNGELKFDDFKKFMDNLQTEVLQMEYNEFAKGSATITEVDFARILLRYTLLNTEEYEAILERLIERIDAEIAADNDVNGMKGITFEEFKDFCLFLNNLDDFQIAMRMYTLADKAIAPEEFSRAVTICTGKHLSPHVVKTVYQIFDNDGDGMLSYQEFVAMMKDRVNRGLKTSSRHEGWSGFKRCVMQETKPN